MTSQCSGTKTQEEYTRQAKTVDRSEESALKLWTIKRRREITVETTQQIVISNPQDVVVAWCQGCADHVGMVTTEQAAVISGVTSRSIYQSVESGELHFTETSEGLLLICVNSLSATDSNRRLPEPPQA